MATPTDTRPITFILYGRISGNRRKHEIGTVTVDVPITLTPTGQVKTAAADGGISLALRKMADMIDASHREGM